MLCDDGIGNYIVEELLQHNSISGINLIVGETDIDYCVDVISFSDYLVVIDAVTTGKEPGTISVFPINESIVTKSLIASTHNHHLFNEIGHKNNFPRGCIIGIEPFNISLGLGLSPILTHAFPLIVHKVQGYINVLLNKEVPNLTI